MGPVMGPTSVGPVATGPTRADIGAHPAVGGDGDAAVWVA
jgi:hypothetical protein